MKVRKNQKTILEAKEIFVDANDYSEYELLGYYRLVKALCKRFNEKLDNVVRISNIQEILNDLDERKSNILRYRYFEGYTRDAIGHKFNISGERVRQIEVSVQELLRFVVFKKRLKDENDSVEVLNLNVRASLALKRAGIKTIAELMKLSYRDLNGIYGIGQAAIQDIRVKLVEHMLFMESAKKISFGKIPIDILNLRNRPNDALKSRGIYTIKQLLELPIEEIYAMRGIGEKSLNEILEKRHELIVKQNNTNELFQEEKIALSTLDMGKRAMNSLMRLEVKTFQDFMKLTKNKVIALKWVGEKTWHEIYQKQQFFLQRGSN